VTLSDAFAIVAPHLSDEICIHSNGYLSRAAHAARDAEGNFYMIGSMGLASSIGLGIALARPKRRVVVFDGDGNVLMALGTLARIASAAPENLHHVCFDNGIHASTGGQATISDRVPLDEVARAAGYRRVVRVDDPATLGAAIGDFLAEPGPSFLHVRIEPGPPGAPGVRIPHTPREMTDRIRHALGVGE